VQLPPVIKNTAFQKYSKMDQSLFTRFVRLGVPYIELNAQGRARPQIAALYNWRYRALGNMVLFCLCVYVWARVRVRVCVHIRAFCTGWVGVDDIKCDDEQGTTGMEAGGGGEGGAY
jgi:hypothetical protein